MTGVIRQIIAQISLEACESTAAQMSNGYKDLLFLLYRRFKGKKELDLEENQR